jgi:hypothetical protein
MPKPTQETFLKDVADHKMTIVRDDGVHRHLTFAKRGSYCMHFEIVTWPGYLCYVGDMGSFVFARITDMFEFFRGSRINPDYWSEKLQATDRPGGHTEWSADKFRSVIEYYLTERHGEPVSKEIRDAVSEEVLSRVDDGEHEAYRAAHEFKQDGFTFDDLWDHNFREFTYRFIWCCYALTWAIGQYDLLPRCTPCGPPREKGTE